jgi:hypothetical protein
MATPGEQRDAFAGLPVYLAWRPAPLVGFSVLVVGTIWCLGLGVLTLRLHRETGAPTPWKKSFLAAVVLALSSWLTIVAG